ncbi:DoxX family protein [Kribbella sandramycini]|uniref:DoxX family protein n=1 Tax=Kribbella sandramycini TaxID=60450 RepID=A0A7Y4P2D3_9ACTN|nr:DoxX family protein [Kribbella sandramycini]MBB6566329.1 putative oxidoreductase [Kribbella sandramycini]NOL43009.1 DoxX family protein [Kribbella sandramycini]
MKVLERYQSQVIAVFRIVIGFLFSCHGAAALFGVLGTRQVEAFVWPSWWASMIQFVGGALVAIGFGTRYAALLCSGSMAYAYFAVHQADALLPVQNGGEKAALFCFAFLLIAFLGNGAWGVERGASTRRQTAVAVE